MMEYKGKRKSLEEPLTEKLTLLNIEGIWLLYTANII